MRPEFAPELDALDQFVEDGPPPPEVVQEFDAKKRDATIALLFQRAGDKRRRRWRNDLAHDQVVPCTIVVKRNIGGLVYELNHVKHVGIRPGETVELPEEYTTAIQTVSCTDAKCKEENDGRCSDRTHPGRKIVGGLAPMLTRVGGQPERHKALTDQIFEIDGEQFRTDGTRVNEPVPPDPHRGRNVKIKE